MLNFMKIHQVVAELFHADGQTETSGDRNDEANSHFSLSCERTLKEKKALHREMPQSVWWPLQLSSAPWVTTQLVQRSNRLWKVLFTHGTNTVLIPCIAAR
jgi:hypothetical protein